MVHENSTGSEDNVELPEDLIASMREMVRAKAPIDGKVDDAVMHTARLHLRDIQPVTPSPSWLTDHWPKLVAALAACALFAVGVQYFAASPNQSTQSTASNPMTASIAREDLDRSGQIDILDALLLANHVKQGAAFKSQWDINDDGQVDQSDVAHIAGLAVRLKPLDRKG